MISFAKLRLDPAALLKIGIVVGAFIVLTFLMLAVTRLILRSIRRLSGGNREWMEGLMQALSPR